MARRPTLELRLFTPAERAYAAAAARPRAPAGHPVRHQGGGAEGPRTRPRRLRVPRRGGGPPRARRPRGRAPRCGGGPPGPPAWGAGTCRSPTPTWWPWPPWWPTGRTGTTGVDVQPVLTVAEMQEVDARAAEVDAPRRAGGPGRDGGGPGRRRPHGGDLRAPGGDHLRQGQQRCRRSGGGRPAGPTRRPGDRRRPGRPRADRRRGAHRRPGGRRRVRHGVPRRLRRARRWRPACPVLAVDIPSGVSGDTGVAAGSVLAATATVTFVAAKPGLLQGDGARLAGDVRVVDIGLPVGGHRIDVVEDADVDRLVPARDPGGNKWVSAVLVVAGSPGMTGAPALASRGAYRAGAGMVRLGVPGGDPGDLPAGEAVGVTLPAEGWDDTALRSASRCHAVVVGPGLGRSEATDAAVRASRGGLAGAGGGGRRRAQRPGPGRRRDHRRRPGGADPARRRVRPPARRSPGTRPGRRRPPAGRRVRGPSPS